MTLHEGIQSRKNSGLLGETAEVLVDGLKGHRWQGRTRNDKLVYLEDAGEHLGDLIRVEITSTSPWSLQGVPVDA